MLSLSFKKTIPRVGDDLNEVHPVYKTFSLTVEVRADTSPPLRDTQVFHFEKRYTPHVHCLVVESNKFTKGTFKFNYYLLQMLLKCQYRK